MTMVAPVFASGFHVSVSVAAGRGRSLALARGRPQNRKSAHHGKARDASWPAGVFSLSHVAVPFRSDDPLHGTAEATRKTGLPLGSLNARGESGVLRISDGQLLRLRHNPFYDYTENHAVEWL